MIGPRVFEWAVGWFLIGAFALAQGIANIGGKWQPRERR